jgi:hypothetical protein
LNRLERGTQLALALIVRFLKLKNGGPHYEEEKFSNITVNSFSSNQPHG